MSGKTRTRITYKKLKKSKGRTKKRRTFKSKRKHRITRRGGGRVHTKKKRKGLYPTDIQKINKEIKQTLEKLDNTLTELRKTQKIKTTKNKNHKKIKSNKIKQQMSNKKKDDENNYENEIFEEVSPSPNTIKEDPILQKEKEVEDEYMPISTPISTPRITKN